MQVRYLLSEPNQNTQTGGNNINLTINDKTLKNPIKHQKERLKDLKDIPTNTKNAFKNGQVVGSSIIRSLKGLIIDKQVNTDEFVNHYQDQIKIAQNTLDTVHDNPNLVNKVNTLLDDPDQDLTEVQNTLQQSANQIDRGLNQENDEVYVYRGTQLEDKKISDNGLNKAKANMFRDQESGKVAVNADQTQLQHGEEVWSGLVEERYHKKQAREGQAYDSTNGTDGKNEYWAESMKQTAKQTWSKRATDTTRGSSQKQEKWLNKQTGNNATHPFQYGNAHAKEAKHIETDAFWKYNNEIIHITKLPGKHFTIPLSKVESSLELYDQASTVVMIAGLAIPDGPLTEGIAALGKVYFKASKLVLRKVVSNLKNKNINKIKTNQKTNKEKTPSLTLSDSNNNKTKVLQLNEKGRVNNKPKKDIGEKKDAVNSTIDYYVKKDGTTIPATGYRALVKEDAVKRAKKGNIMAENADETYITFDNITNKSGAEIKDFLQLTRKPTHIATFDTSQIIDNIWIPKEKWNEGKAPEPIITSYPNLGSGGGTQAMTNEEITKFKLEEISNE